jgi:hypothetical protein
VIVTTAGLVRAALTGCTPVTFTAYCGTPSSSTGWSYVIASVEPTTSVPNATIGVTGRGTPAPDTNRRTLRRERLRLLIVLGMKCSAK